MKTAVRFAVLLLALSGFTGLAAHAAAPVANNTAYATAIPNGNGPTLLFNNAISATIYADADANLTVTELTFVTVPTKGVLYAYNVSNGASVQVTAGLTVSPLEYPAWLYDPNAGATGSDSFTFSVADNTNATSNTATYTINSITSGARVNAAPFPRQITSPLLQNTAGDTPLAYPLFAADVDGSISSYTLLTVPDPATQGTLKLNGVAVPVNQPLTPAQAASLTFDPIAGLFGNVTFSYNATDNNGASGAASVLYAIPVGNAGCNKNSVLDFAARPMLEDWTTGTQAVKVGATTISASGFSVPGYTGSVPSALRIEANPTMPGNALVWTSDYPNNATNKTATVTFTLSRFVSGFSMSMGDVDFQNASWTDQVRIEGYQSNGTIYTLSAANAVEGTNVTQSGNTFTGSGANSTSPDGNTVVTFPVPINKVVITYSNTTTAANPGQQLLTFESFSWCAADVATVVSGPARATTGNTVTYTVTTTNNSAENALNVQPTLQLPIGVTPTIPGTASYNSTTGVVTFANNPTVASGAVVTNTVTFTMPSNSVSGVAASTVTVDDQPENNNGSLSAAQVTTQPNQAPVARNITSPTLVSGTANQPIPALVATDPNGDNTIASYVITAASIPNTATQGSLKYTRDNGTVVSLTTASSLTDRTLTPTEISRLTFSPVVVAVAITPTFTYTAVDDIGATSNTATYTIPVAPSATGGTDLAVTQQVQLGPYSLGETVTFTVTATNNGAAATSVQVRDQLPGGLTFVSATPSVGSYDPSTGIWTIGNFANGASATLAIQATLSQNGTFTNTATISGAATQAETNLNNNQASQTVNPGTTAYAQDFEGRIVTDLCEAVTNMSLNDGGTTPTLTGNESLLSGALSTTLSSYTTPFLRLNGSSVVTFQAKASATTNTPVYRVNIIDAAGNSTAVQASTAFGNANVQNLSVSIPQSGVYKVQIGFTTAAASTTTVSLDQVSVSNAAVATAKNDGNDCTVNVLPVADAKTFRVSNQASATTIPALTGSDTAPGSVSSFYIQTITSPTTQGTLTLDGAALRNGQEISLADASRIKFTPVSGYVGTAEFLYSSRDNTGELSEAATYSISVENSTTISGIIFDDVNYGGGAGRDFAAANTAAQASGFANNAIGRSGATVELYDTESGAIVNTISSGTNGAYTFPLVLSGNYSVRVVNSTVTSVRNSAASGVVPVQTYVKGVTNYVGGVDPTKEDAAANSGSQLLSALTAGNKLPQSISTVSIPTVVAAATNVNFGFNFDAVVNTNDTGQGSLRQFITNANALPNTNLNQEQFNNNGTPTGVNPAAGIESAIFMMNDGRTSDVLAGLRTGLTAPAGYSAATKAFTITLSSALPSIIDGQTTIDGSTQTALTGDGPAASDATTTDPEVIVNFNNNAGLFVTGASTRLASLGLSSAVGNSTATSGAVLAQGAGVTVSGAAATGTTITDVTTLNNATAGVLLTGGATGVTVTANVLRTGRATVAAAGIAATDAEGVVLQNASGNTVTNNFISNNAGYGIELSGAGANSTNNISGNTINNNGTGGTANDSGISIQLGTNNLISGNTINNNSAAGIAAGTGTSGNRFTQNSIFLNGAATGLGIDLASAASPNGDGTTVNDNGDGDSGANGILNFPIITQSVITNTTTGNLEITGFAPAGALLEFFVSDATTAAFGEGRTYLTARTEGLSTQDVDTRTWGYSGLINGLNQGTESGVNRYAFIIPISSLNSTQRAALTAANARITATATLLSGTLVNGTAVGNTSEFSGNAAVGLNQPLPVELTSFEAKAKSADALLTWETASEKNNDHFDVERSIDGKTFEKVGSVEGHGSTSAKQQYAYTDANAARTAATVYYRLVQVDFDGTATASEIRTVRFGASNATVELALYPSPAADYLNVTLQASAQQATVQVYSTTGALLMTQALDSTLRTTLDLRRLPAGVYNVKVQGANGLSLTRRFVKQ
ncbi:T9SS type A sorting domain-containing protein [Hymenobacter busanensis]|uniref:T9SS type A sorting domain-containing protein n=1 Tax=Hymenobacter busanensis TaxID=2607656 RepID=A0A7L5A2D6_9BACT|nr:right-handed parallel beta-helix repeat-containing protein [Hymenobacter busanensis]KAA9338300.1 T9SS type A sorting domain-containing protein [Hymenobacter busanensis]QHJ09276.1 T9SS type A sorting domain-containing protein [Hymenobacter busanensis]